MEDKPSIIRDAAWDDDALYASEIKRRIADVEAGTAPLVPADEAIARARKALSDARGPSRRR